MPDPTRFGPRTRPGTPTSTFEPTPAPRPLVTGWLESHGSSGVQPASGHALRSSISREKKRLGSYDRRYASTCAAPSRTNIGTTGSNYRKRRLFCLSSRSGGNASSRVKSISRPRYSSRKYHRIEFPFRAPPGVGIPPKNKGRLLEAVWVPASWVPPRMWLLARPATREGVE